MNNFKLNENICFYRKKHSLTQEDLAKALGVTNQSVSKWESAQCCPDISLIPQIAQMFDISIDELFGQEPKVNAEKSEFLLYDDDVFRVFVAQGKKILTAEDMNELKNEAINIRFPQDTNEKTKQCYKVEVFGNLHCKDSIIGDVTSHGNIECKTIGGAVLECGNNISCQGTINGCASAENNISCGTINGGVHVGNNISCGTVNGGVNCGNNVACGSDIKGNVECFGNVRCKTIEGDVQCEGDIIYE